MKKILISLFLLSLMFLGMNKAQAMKYEDAIQQNKPCAILIYASWADNLDSYLTTFNNIEKKYAGKYNFARIDITKEEAKAFNKTQYIYPNLPYILLFKDRTRMSRCVTQSCAKDISCISDKMDIFAE